MIGDLSPARDRSLRRRMSDSRVRRFITPLGLVVLVLAFFHRMAFSNLILARGDTFLYFYPYWTAAATALREGRIPFWNPDLFMGAPFLANSQVGFFYPLNWPVWLILPTPYAVNASILIHLAIAGWGAFLASRRTLGVGTVAGFLAGALFALGGYLTAQIEHINQLQGLAWLPWYFAALQSLVEARVKHLKWATLWPAILAVAALFALQLLAGHTQTVFISGVSVSVWLLGQSWAVRHERARSWQWFAVLIAGALMAMALAALQLLPTLELIQQSSRQGGLALNEVLSFSWHPVHLTRAILPPYDPPLFSEYIAFVPITALALFFVGAWSWRRDRAVAVWLLLVVVALVLAFGRFMPVFYLLGNLPVFNLFRVPARWLAPAALGAALLAGMGWQRLRSLVVVAPPDKHGRREVMSALRPPLAAAVLSVLSLVVWGYLAAWPARYIPTGAEAPFEPPGLRSVAGWLVEAALAATLFWLILTGTRARARYACYGLVGLTLTVLWLGSRQLPYNQLTTPAAYFDLRPPAARLIALASCVLPERACPATTDRFLSLSDIFFDVGDQGEIDSIYANQLDPAARYDHTVAIKHKEVLSPNLSLELGLPAVDGFDGGILPLRNYAALMQLVLTDGTAATDGRLREYLVTVPEERWLSLFNARYIITDKVGDAWREGVFFDRQLPVTLGNEPLPVGEVPPFEATELWLLSDGTPPDVEVATSEGHTWRLSPEPLSVPGLFRAAFPEAATATALTLVPCDDADDACQADALSLVDARDGTFLPLVAGPLRLIYSGDVKIYENLAVLPRAYQVFDWQLQPDSAAALETMAQPSFDPHSAAVLVDAGVGGVMPTGDGIGTVTVTDYAPERVTLQATADRDNLVVLSDAIYPGWRVTVDGDPASIVQANGFFRGVLLPAGEHEVVFTFQPNNFSLGVGLTLAALLAMLVGVLLLVLRRLRSDQTSPTAR